MEHVTVDAKQPTLTLNQADELARLAFLTADALEGVVRAALHGDRTEARRVLGGSAALRDARVDGEKAVRRLMRSCSGRTGSLRYTACRLQFISDLGDIATLVEGLARDLAANDVPAPVLEAVGTELATVGAAGAQRLRTLAAGSSGPGMDASYVRCGCELRGAAERLSGRHDQPIDSRATRMSTVTLCAGLAEAVLVASRHAARAA